MPVNRSTILAVLCSIVACVVPAWAQQATHIIMVKAGDDYRSIQLHIPAGYDGQAPLPLVFNLHGSNSVAEQQEMLSGMFAVADEKQFLVAGGMAVYEYPAGRRTWNADLDPNGVSDIAYISAAIEAINRKTPVDRKRIFVTGMSGGGRMTSRIGCELADTIAAIAPVAGVQFGAGCNPARPMPMITFHGVDDRVNTYGGGNLNGNPNWVSGVEQAISRWADHNGCSEKHDVAAVSDEVSRWSYADCPGGADVILYRIANGGHTWPGSPIADRVFGQLGVTNMDINASRLMWTFFAAHPLP